MSTTILVDGNSVGYAQHYGTKLRSGELETQAIFGFVRKMREMRMGYRGCRIVVLWDGRAQWRFDLLPEYKSNRDSDPKKLAFKAAYVAQRPYIAKALEHLGVQQITGKHHEADDLAGYFTPKLLRKNPDNKIVLFSGDNDWIQLVQENVIWRDASPLRPDNIVKHTNLLDKKGYKTPLAFLEGKCLQGDTSDVISGVGGIAEAGAPVFLAEWGSVGNFFKAVDAGTYTPKVRKDPKAKTPHPEQALASPEGRALFLRNLKLMQLMRVEAPKREDLLNIPGHPDKQAFRELCEELSFSSIVREMDSFFEPFESVTSE